MKRPYHKYLRKRAQLVLCLYLSFLIVASFHSHNLNFYSNPSISVQLNNSFVESTICLFNQINKTAYFFNFTEYYLPHSLQQQHLEPLPIDKVFHSLTFISVSDTRAPPFIS